MHGPAHECGGSCARLTRSWRAGTSAPPDTMLAHQRQTAMLSIGSCPADIVPCTGWISSNEAWRATEDFCGNCHCSLMRSASVCSCVLIEDPDKRQCSRLVMGWFPCCETMDCGDHYLPLRTISRRVFGVFGRSGAGVDSFISCMTTSVMSFTTPFSVFKKPCEISFHSFMSVTTALST